MGRRRSIKQGDLAYACFANEYVLILGLVKESHYKVLMKKNVAIIPKKNLKIIG